MEAFHKIGIIAIHENPVQLELGTCGIERCEERTKDNKYLPREKKVSDSLLNPMLERQAC